MKKLLLIIVLLSGCANSRKHEDRLAYFCLLCQQGNITDSTHKVLVKIENERYNKKPNIYKPK